MLLRQEPARPARRDRLRGDIQPQAARPAELQVVALIAAQV
jgi:hypothetical protein